MKVKCGNCGKEATVEKLHGKQVKCTKCGSAIEIVQKGASLSAEGNWKPGEKVQKTGTYKCIYCGPDGIAAYVCKNVQDAMGTSSVPDVVSQNPVFQFFQEGDIFTNCPNCEKLVADAGGNPTRWEFVSEHSLSASEEKASKIKPSTINPQQASNMPAKPKIPPQQAPNMPEKARALLASSIPWKPALLGILAVVVGIVAYSVLKPPSFSKIERDVVSGDKSQKDYALKTLESYGEKKDTRAIPILISALNSNTASTRARASKVLKKFGDSAIPEIVSVLQNSSEEYTTDARIEAVKILQQLNVTQAKKEIYGVCKSSKTPEDLRNAAVETLIALFPEYQKEYHLQDGMWLTPQQLSEKGYVQIEGKWESVESLINHVEQKFTEAQKAKDIFAKHIESYSKTLSPIKTESELIAFMKPWETCMRQYGAISNSLQFIKKYENSGATGIKEGIDTLERKISQDIVDLAAPWMALAKEYRTKAQPAVAMSIIDALFVFFAKVSQWEWSPSFRQSFTSWIEKNRPEHDSLSSQVEILVEVTIQDPNASQQIETKFKDSLQSLLWNGDKIPKFIVKKTDGKIKTEESTTSEDVPEGTPGAQKKIAKWLTASYQEKRSQVEPDLLDMNKESKPDQKFQIRCHIAYWESDEKSEDKKQECIWETIVSEEYLQSDDKKKLKQDDFEDQSRSDFWSKLIQKEIPWKEMPDLVKNRRSEEKVEGSTLYRQTAEDKIYFNDGRTVSGLIKADEKDHLEIIHFITTSRGKRMLASQKLEKKSIQKIDRIPDDVRRYRLKIIESEEEEKAKDKKSINSIKLETIEWKFGSKGVGLKYVDDRFILMSNAPGDFVREISFRTSKMFKAYERFFQVQRNPKHKIQIFFFNSMIEYYNAIGAKIMNPAFYWPEKNYIVAGCDLDRYKEEVERVRKYHSEIKQQIEVQKGRIDGFRQNMTKQKREMHSQLDKMVEKGGISTQSYNQAYQQIRAWENKQNEVLQQYTKALKDLQEKIYLYDYQNKKMVERFAGDMICVLYHEAFHAFLQNFLFPEDQVKSVPLWLNEGLSQFFENSFLQGNNLLIGQMDQKRVKMLRQFIRDEKTIPLSQFLTADGNEFLVKDIRNLENSNIHYLQSWALVYYLVNTYDLSQGNFFAEYVRDLWKGSDPKTAFEKLTQKSLEKSDQEWKETIMK